MGLKVLHLIDSGGLYGAEKMLLSLVKEQLKTGLEPMILSAGELDVIEKPIEAEAKRLGLPVIPWRMKPGLNLKESFKILRWAKKNRYDLLHSHGFKFNVLLGIYPERVRKIPMIATLHGYVYAPRFSKLWFYECVDRLAIKKMRGIALVAEAMRLEFSNRHLPDTTEVISNGLDLAGLQEASQSVLHDPLKSFVDEHDTIIIGVGRLSHEKGFDRLIKAFFLFKREHVNSGLVIIGEGSLREQLENLMSDFGIEADVLMPGYCNEVPALMVRSHLLVMPSSTEGLPITLLEAMSLNVPVVASAVGDVPVVLSDGECGGLLRDIEPVTIASAMKESFDDKELSIHKAERAHQTVSKYYSSETMAGRYFELYTKVLAPS
jgi:glycosyltransferase involved in cell wall biosynthesis|tara:strand:+ start:11959 stop:13092 length:1134 start_codon:yes stop_codon:yes gene_type:complete